MKTVTIFGSSKPKKGESEYEVARELGSILAQEGFIVCNGGYMGTMEASSMGAKECNGKTVGVTVPSFGIKPNRYIDEEVKAGDIHERIKKLIEGADAFVILKGGSGTLAELAISVELILKGMTRLKPVVLLGDFFGPVVELIRSEAAYEIRRGSVFDFKSLDDFLFFAKDPAGAVAMIRERLA